MNSLTNEQRLRIIELYYRNACSVKKVYRTQRVFRDEAYFRFNEYLNKQIRPFKAAIRAIVTKFRTQFAPVSPSVNNGQ